MPAGAGGGGSTTSSTPATPASTSTPWNWQGAGAALGAGIQNFSSQYQGPQNQSGRPVFYTDQFNRMWQHLEPTIDPYLAEAQRQGGYIDQARGLMLSSMGPTDISEMAADRRRALNFSGQLYQPFHQAIGTLSDYRKQLGSGTTTADVAAGRQMREAETQMRMAPGMTAATRGAAMTNAREQMAEASYKERLGQYGQATGALAGAQTALGQAQMQGMNIAAQLAAQMAGIRAQDAMRILQGSTALAQMALNDPRLAAQYAVFQARMTMIQNATGRETSTSTSNTGAWIAGGATIAAAAIVAI